MMAEAGTIKVGLELTEEARALTEVSLICRRFGSLEVAIPQAWHELTREPDNLTVARVDAVFVRLLDLLKSR